MSELDYRAMLVAVMAEAEDVDEWPWWMPEEVEAWWRGSPDRAERDAEAHRQRRDAEISLARGDLEYASEVLAKWRARVEDHAWVLQQLAAAEEAHEQALAVLKSLTADEASAMVAPQAADPARVVADLEATIPHSVPHESPKEG